VCRRAAASPVDAPWLWTLAYRPCASGDEYAQITDVYAVQLQPCQAFRISFHRSRPLHRQIQLGFRHPRKQRVSVPVTTRTPAAGFKS
jgi:hypothetical protein